MSVVARETRLRWAALAAGLALLLSAPTVVPLAAGWVDAATGDPPPTTSVDALLDRAVASAGVAHSGVAESRGSLGLPDLPRLEGVAGLLGGTTRARVWWSSPEAWRVDTLSATGEQGDYGRGDDVVTWDYERDILTRAVDVTGVRLPRADDLLPPQAARRLLAGVGPQDRLEHLGDRRVAGRAATGLRAVPADDRSTIARLDVWVDAASGLPLELRVVGTDGADALVSRFVEVSLGEPAENVLVPPAAPGAPRENSPPDVASAADLESPWDLPSELAGLPATFTPLGGTAVYGDGLTRLTVLPLPNDLARQVLNAAAENGAERLQLPRGQSVLVGTPLLNVVVARGYDRRHAYVVAGLVAPELLEQATSELFADPPPFRRPGDGPVGDR